MKFTAIVAAILGMVTLPHAHAVVLIGWDPQGMSEANGGWPENWSSSSQGGTVTVDSGVQITAGLGRGSGTSLAGLNNAWGAGTVDKSSRAAAIEDNDYLFFSLAPQEGNMMSLSALDYNIRLVSGPWNTGDARYLWQYKVGDGSFVDIGAPLALVGEYNTNGAAQPTLDLSGIAALQNITEEVELRVYAWNSGQFIFGRLPGNDLALSGSVSAVPEPSRMLFLMMGVSILMLRRSRIKLSSIVHA